MQLLLILLCWERRSHNWWPQWNKVISTLFVGNQKDWMKIFSYNFICHNITHFSYCKKSVVLTLFTFCPLLSCHSLHDCICCRQLQDELQELFPNPSLALLVSQVWGSKSPNSDHIGRWCQIARNHGSGHPQEEKYLHIGQRTCGLNLLEEVVHPSTLLSQCYRSHWNLSISLQPRQYHIY